MKTLLCDCNRTMPLDRPALAQALAHADPVLDETLRRIGIAQGRKVALPPGT